MQKLIAAFIVITLLACGAAPAQTAKTTYPDRPVRIIVPFGASGPGDTFARLVAKKLSEQLGQEFYIVNHPGAGGNIGTSLVARSPADGYTLLVGSSTVWVNPSLYPDIPYDPVKDLAPIILAATSAVVLVVNPNVPATTVQDLIKLVRAGTYNNFAMPGAGTPPDLSTELFKQSLNLNFVTVPFNGGGPMIQSVVAGHTPIAFSALPAAMGQIQAGTLRALAVTSAKHLPILPDVPTMEEAGVPGQEQEAPQCVWAPAGTPREIVDLLYREIAKAVASPEIKDRMASLGFVPAAVPPEQLAGQIKADMPKWAKVVHDAGMKPE